MSRHIAFALFLVISLAGTLAFAQLNISMVQVNNDRCWDACPTWYPDGQHILIASDRLGGMTLWKLTIGGGVAIQVTSSFGDTRDMWPDVNSKTGEIIFISDRSGVAQVFSVQTGQMGLTQLTHMPYDVTHPRWSPEGKRISFCCPDSKGENYIWIIDRDGNNLRQICEGFSPCWSPDGKRFAFAKRSLIGKDWNWDIYTIGVDGTGLAQVTSGANQELQPDWSPDGNWLAYVAIQEKKINSFKKLSDIFKGLQEKKWNYEIWIRNVSEGTTAPIQLTSWTGIDMQPQWSPNGKQMLLSSDRAGSLDVWITNGELPLQ